MEQQFSVIVTKPGHDTVRIGPIPWRHEADSISANLNQQLHSTAAPEGTHSASAPYDPEQPHLPLLALNAYALAEQMTAEPDGDPEARFPDLYSRFAAQIGYDERGPAMWSTACMYADAMTAEPGTEQEPAEDEDLRAEIASLRAELEQARAEVPPAVTVDELAQLIHAADVHVNDGDYPSWDDLSNTPGLGKDDVRKAARWLLKRLSISALTAPACTCRAEPVHQAGCDAVGEHQ